MERAVTRMRAAAGAYGAMRGTLEAGAPWPLADRFGTEPEAHWGPPEVLAHVQEMLPFWLGEIARILAGPEPAPFGRVASDHVRLAIIERDRTVPPGDLLDRIDADVERYARRLPSLGTADLARRGLHPRRGEMTVAQVLEDFVVRHLEEHVLQLQDALGAA
jgi:hypothetical protein